MKRIALVLSLILIAHLGFTQKSNVISCWNYLKEGVLDEAKSSIDKAAEHKKTSDWWKTWYYHGQTYHMLAISKKPKYQKLCDSCADIAFSSYMKSLRLNCMNEDVKKANLETQAGIMTFIKALRDDDTEFEDNKAFVDVLTTRLPALSAKYVNDGVAAFQTGSEYEKALENFEKALSASSLSSMVTGKVDTQVYYYTSLAAINAKNWEKSIEYNKLLKQMEYGETNEEKAKIYKYLATSYKNSGDTAKFIETLKAGIEKYPENNYDLIIDMFNHYVSTNQSEKAYEYISLAIERQSNKAQFYVIRGTLLEEMERGREAAAQYKKAIELDPDNFDANYSMGAYYYNYAADTLAWANENIPPTDFEQYDAVKAEADKLFEKALPYLEKAYSMKPKDINVLQTLKTIYYRLQEMEKHDKIKTELDALVE